MSSAENAHSYHGREALAILAGWSPKHRSPEAEAAELSDMTGRDTAACVTFPRGTAR